jgi:hypothetical protein
VRSEGTIAMNLVKLLKVVPTKPSLVGVLSSKLVLSAFRRIKHGQLSVGLCLGTNTLAKLLMLNFTVGAPLPEWFATAGLE